MTQKKAALKALRQGRRQEAKNLKIRKAVRNLIKAADRTAAAGQLDKARDLARQVQKAVDKAVRAKVFRPNAGNRKKARLSQRLNKLAVK